MKVYVISVGIITSNGFGLEDFKKGIFEGISGVSFLKNNDYSKCFVKIGAEICDEKLANNNFNEERALKIILPSVDEAINKLPPGMINELEKLKNGIILGTSYTGFYSVERVVAGYHTNQLNLINPMSVIRGMKCYPAGIISQKFGINGFSFTIDTACSSSLHAIGIAYNMVRSEVLDFAVVGGVDTPLLPENLLAWSRLKILDNDENNPKNVPKPFDKDRKGIVIGEGAGCVIIVSEKLCEKFGLTPLAEICGYGYSNDTSHITHTNHKSIEEAIKKSFQEHPELFEKINYIQAHGTGTPVNDLEETIAIKNVFKEKAYKLKVNSLKSMIGHTMGASGILSTVATVIQMKEKRLHPTINLNEPDPECDLDYVPNKSIEYEIDCALVNAFAFGGSNAVILLKNIN